MAGDNVGKLSQAGTQRIRERAKLVQEDGDLKLSDASLKEIGNRDANGRDIDICHALVSQLIEQYEADPKKLNAETFYRVQDLVVAFDQELARSGTFAEGREKLVFHQAVLEGMAIAVGLPPNIEQEAQKIGGAKEPATPEQLEVFRSAVGLLNHAKEVNPAVIAKFRSEGAWTPKK